jgi:hypothetical protein
MKRPFLPLAQRPHTLKQVGVYHHIQWKLFLLFQRLHLPVVDHPSNMQYVRFVKIGWLQTNRLVTLSATLR